MSTEYPAAIDNFTNPDATSRLSGQGGVSHSELHADLNDAVEAIETELGTNPSGASATVKARFDAADAALVAEAGSRAAGDAYVGGVLAAGYTAADAAHVAAVDPHGDRAYVDSALEDVALFSDSPVTPTEAQATNTIWTYGWPCPRAVYSEAQQRIYFGGTSDTGMAKAAMLDLTTNEVSTIDLVDHQADDHDTPAMLWEDDQVGLIVLGDHGRTAYGEQWKSSGAHTFGGLSASQITWSASGAPSYGQLIRKPGTDDVMVIYRGHPSETGQHMKLSTDWGANWGTQYRVWGGQDYGTHNISADGATLWMALSYNPQNPTNQIRVFQVDLASGTIKNAGATVTAAVNWWTLSGTAITSGETTVAMSTLSPPACARLYDVSQTGDVACCTFNDGDTTGTYKVLRRSGNTYTAETLCNAGVAFGYTQSMYNGGMVFDGTGNSVILVREDDDVWTLERWTYANSTWTGTVLYTAEGGNKLGRPIVPRGAEGAGLILFLDIEEYAQDAYDDFLAHGRLLIENPSDASQVSITPLDGITATDVQGALAQLNKRLAALE